MIEAYWRCSPPHTPIMKYIGSRTTSKKTKKRMRSWARNVPTMPVSRMRIRMRKALGLLRLGEVVPGVDDAQRHDQHGQGDQRQRDAVEAHDVAAVDERDPRLVDDELQLAGRGRSRSWRSSSMPISADGQAGDQGDRPCAAAPRPWGSTQHDDRAHQRAGTSRGVRPQLFEEVFHRLVLELLDDERRRCRRGRPRRRRGGRRTAGPGRSGCGGAPRRTPRRRRPCRRRRRRRPSGRRAR